MFADNAEELEAILGLVWITETEREELKQWVAAIQGKMTTHTAEIPERGCLNHCLGRKHFTFAVATYA